MNKGDVVFLYVSFDQSNTRAIEFIKDREFKGVHLFDTKGFNSEVAMKYNIQSIPRYVLIDKQGQLISDKGPRPSAHPEEMIRNALSK
jgi:thioredoxin-related protein